jgi:dTDP-3-amino-2,3,6-trideoxy-4-keto-D-glucose/dTDP-3-amino-3,4,6-trideoxy-alpha-D-glucose/dTDP-2,6-dideoxy-D-kanosamine transaminase
LSEEHRSLRLHPEESTLRVPFSYLPEQFADPEPIFARLREVIAAGDFTLGTAVSEFEARFANTVGVQFAFGVGSGTEGLRLALKIFGVGPGDEVITAANTFIATVGAIADTGAVAKFVDCKDDFCMDVSLLQAAITPRTKAIIPVHMTGAMVDMPRLLAIAAARGIPVIEDACQAVKSSLDERPAGSWGVIGAFSLHPLKFINIWGDGGVMTTNDADIAKRISLLRNHGLQSRDVIVSLGVNSRLDTVQAVVALHLLDQADWIANQRRTNAAFYDQALAHIEQVRIPPRDPRVLHSYVTYQVLVERRDALLAHCAARAIECKIHYPIPLYCQQGLRHLGYKQGDFPVTDRHADTTITLPVHQYLSRDQLSFVVDSIEEFYRS